MRRLDLLILAATVATILPAGSATAQPAGNRAPAPQSARYKGVPAQRPVVFRHQNVDLAWQAAQKSGRPVMVFITSADCFYCKKMVAETLSHPQIARATNQRYETALLSNETQPELVEKLGVRAFPTTMIVNTDGSTLARVLGFVEPAKFAAQLLPSPTRQAQAPAVQSPPATR